MVSDTANETWWVMPAVMFVVYVVVLYLTPFVKERARRNAKLKYVDWQDSEGVFRKEVLDVGAREARARTANDSRDGRGRMYNLLRSDTSGREAAIVAYRRAEESGTAEAQARSAAIEAYCTEFASVLEEQGWSRALTEEAVNLDCDKYERIQDGLFDSLQQTAFCSTDALRRLTGVASNAATRAYRQTREHGESQEIARQRALAAYQAAATAGFEKEQTAVAGGARGSMLKSLSAQQVRDIEYRMVSSGNFARFPTGSISVTGFLQPGERLLQVVERDEQALRELGITPEQVADRLETLIMKASRAGVMAFREQSDLTSDQVSELLKGSQGLPVGEDFRLRVRSYEGAQECPFEDVHGCICRCSTFGDSDFSITNTRTNATLDFPGLIVHLIREHHFFEGSVPCRVDPRAAADVLALAPGIDYRPSLKTEVVWRLVEGAMATGDTVLDKFPHLRKVKEEPQTVLEFEDGAAIFVRGRRCLSIAEHKCAGPADLMVAGSMWPAPTIPAGTWGFERGQNIYVDL